MPRPPADRSSKHTVRRALFAGGIGLATSTAAIALQLLPAPPVAALRSTLPASLMETSTVADWQVAKPAATPLMHPPGRSAMPQLLPVHGWFSDGFRWRQDPLHGLRRFHGGLDIAAPAGAIVRAPADGLVTYAANTGGYGNMIEIRHGDQYGTRFAHLAAFLTEAGRIVHLGQPIGLVGSSGRTKGAHLHYEVLKEGRRVNPWPYLGDQKVDPQRTTFSVTHTTVRAER
jgi:murein DD-endopeptidase MepM/ murein hydrolase activator NlpD